MREYIYLGDRNTDDLYRGRGCRAVISAAGKCIRGKNGSMLVSFDGRKVVVMARRLRKKTNLRKT